MGRRSLNDTAAALLGLLQEGPMTGWDLVSTAQHRIGNFWSITQSQVYRELATMSGSGLVEASEPGPRERKPYHITEAGTAAFREWIERDPASEQVRFPLLLSIMFAEHLSRARLDEMIDTHRAAHAEKLAGYERQYAELNDGAPDDPNRSSRPRLATLEFGLRYERAVLDWFDRLPEILDR